MQPLGLYRQVLCKVWQSPSVRQCYHLPLMNEVWFSHQQPTLTEVCPIIQLWGRSLQSPAVSGSCTEWVLTHWFHSMNFTGTPPYLPLSWSPWRGRERKQGWNKGGKSCKLFNSTSIQSGDQGNCCDVLYPTASCLSTTRQPSGRRLAQLPTISRHLHRISRHLPRHPEDGGNESTGWLLFPSLLDCHLAGRAGHLEHVGIWGGIPVFVVTLLRKCCDHDLF